MAQIIYAIGEMLLVSSETDEIENRNDDHDGAHKPNDTVHGLTSFCFDK